jgi:hypothetical protein
MCRLWDAVEKYGRAGDASGGNVTRRMRILDNKDNNTRSQYAIFIVFPRQQKLRKRASVLRSM